MVLVLALFRSRQDLCYCQLLKLALIGLSFHLFQYACTRWHSWLRHCATNRKFAVSFFIFVIFLSAAIWLWATAVAQWLRCCATNPKVVGSIPAGVSGFSIDIKFSRSHYGPGVDSASIRNEYQAYFLRVKAAGA